MSPSRASLTVPATVAESAVTAAIDSGATLDSEVSPGPVASLSPSRAADFKACPLLFRFRTIDKLPEPPSSAAVRGTVVHAVLERLFDLPASGRTLVAAQALVDPVWRELIAEDPELVAVCNSPANRPVEASAIGDDVQPNLEKVWLAGADTLLQTYFRLEDPTLLEPAAREQRVEVDAAGLRLRGIIDRIDVSASGQVRIVDYKTGASPREAFEAKAMFQLKFYALVLWKTRGEVPAALRLMYLADGETLTYAPDAAELQRFERTLIAIAAAINRAIAARDFRPHRSRLCEWCAHQALCPAFGGTPPPYPPYPARESATSPAAG